MPEHIIVLMLYGLAAYLIGAIPFGLVIAKLFGLGDIRNIGSGNIGATNVLRTGNKIAAALTLLLDSGKGLFVVMIARYLNGDSNVIAITGLLSIVGHCYPIWLGFRGGKGVATGLGVFLGFHPLVGAMVCLVWLVTAFLFRFSSLAAIISYTSAPILFALISSPPLPVLTVITAGMIAALAIWRHRGNIKRLFSGTEPRIGMS
ncbi:MAG: glycerol-3-phosphate 1-O-acyltransferase PlsY [Proteobacteria bacterium]|nr:glycerol-3-phosphate 1-O-acyltransferase PlsY [Pseudomonadota bacterium]MDA0909267.1 glycerol-3-phosphate 1-O-acyltransferase PlsY [Pseudomonadota bacterium]